MGTLTTKWQRFAYLITMFIPVTYLLCTVLAFIFLGIDRPSSMGTLIWWVVSGYVVSHIAHSLFHWVNGSNK